MYLPKTFKDRQEKRKYRKSKVSFKNFPFRSISPAVVLRFCRETERGWAGLGVLGAGVGLGWGCSGIPEAEVVQENKCPECKVIYGCKSLKHQGLGQIEQHLHGSCEIQSIKFKVFKKNIFFQSILESLCGKLWDKSFPP